VWACLSGLVVVVAVGARSTGRRLALLAAVAAVLVLLGFLRLQTLEVACVALTLATLVSERAQRLLRVAGPAAMLVCVPVLFGDGSRGSSVRRALDGPGRAARAQCQAGEEPRLSPPRPPPPRPPIPATT
jgi:hypothetical protein